MTLHAYCVRRAGEPPPAPEARGVAGAEVRLVEGERLGLWVSPVERPPGPDPEHLREHDRVVRHALRTRTPLPLRFGAVFADEAAALAALEARSAELLAGLERVAGRVEMGVAVLWDAAAERERLCAARPELRAPEGPPASGRAYLEARRRERELEAALRGRAEALLEEVSTRLAEAVSGAEEARTVLPPAEAAGALAHLVQVGRVAGYREAVARAAGALPGVELRASGPWAPYSFV